MNTTYFLNCASGNLFGTKKTPAIPTAYYIGLSTSEPTINGDNVTEPTGNGYARVDLTGILGEPTAGVVKNKTPINFNESTANWGLITHFVVFDAPTNGNLLMYGQLSTPRNVETATIMTIKEGFLTLSAQNPN